MYHPIFNPPTPSGSRIPNAPPEQVPSLSAKAAAERIEAKIEKKEEEEANTHQNAYRPTVFYPK